MGGPAPALLALAAAVGLGWAAAAQQASPPRAGQTDAGQTDAGQTGTAGEGPGPSVPFVAVVNGAAVVENSRAARALRQTERDLRERVQAENDRVQSELEAEERDLVRLRDQVPAAEFEARTAAFDRMVRAERRRAQERGALLVSFVQDARAALLSALPRVLEELRREAGAAMIVDAGAVLAADPTLDLTDAAIARYDARLGSVRFDPPAGLLPAAEPDAPAVPPDAAASGGASPPSGAGGAATAPPP